MDHPMNANSHNQQQQAGGMNPMQGAGMGTMNMGQGGYQQGMYPQGVGYPMYAPYYPQENSSLFGFANDRFLKGLLIGAAAAYLLTNENVQRTAIKGAVKAWGLLQGGVEELKERFHDAEAEIRSESAE